MIDITTLRSIHEQQGRLPRVLDVACGTGLLLKQLLAQVPDIEAYGLDANDFAHVLQSFQAFARKRSEFYAFLVDQTTKWASEVQSPVMQAEIAI